MLFRVFIKRYFEMYNRISLMRSSKYMLVYFNINEIGKILEELFAYHNTIFMRK